MKKLIKVLLLISTLCTLSIADDLNINKVLKQAHKENKQVMFFFHIPRCPYCESMLDENFKDEDVLKEIENNFILIDIYSVDKGTVSYHDFKGDRKEFAKYLGARVVPATIFMDISGKITHKAIGYRNIDEYLVDLKYVGTKSYNSIGLEEFAEELELSEE